MSRTGPRTIVLAILGISPAAGAQTVDVPD
jgi:hypothetical protein